MPQLVLEEVDVRERVTEQSGGPSPIVMMTVLALSFGMSLLLLLMPEGGSGTVATTQAEARAIIENEYLQGSPLEPYQELLRQALEAHARGDTAAERRLYRGVLDMLHAEGNNERSGLTGDPYGTRAPSDKDLEKQLSTLLNER